MAADDIVAVVDRDDRVLGTKRRGDLAPDDIVRVSVLWVENDRGEVLIQQRTNNRVTGAGLWSPAVAGTVEAHESYRENVIKEAEEELGLVGVEPEEVGKRLRLGVGEPFGRMLTFFRARMNLDPSELKLERSAVARVKWVDKQWLIEDYEQHPERYVVSARFWRELFY
jgi:isopentenyldiphosphate isomerase